MAIRHADRLRDHAPGAADPADPVPCLLEVRGIGKSFGGHQALSDVGFSLRAGEVLALLGENGAGKSTLIKILAGVHPLDEGSIRHDGRDVSGALGELPIAFIHQDLGLIDWMTVLENVCLTRGFGRRAGGLISWSRSRASARDALAALGLDIDPDQRVAELGRTERSLVAIARAVSTQARIVVMDEPTAALPADEVNRLFAAVERLRAAGTGVIYVSHRLEEIFTIADRVVVLRDGRVAGESEVADLSPERLIHMIVGRSGGTMRRAPAAGPAPVVLEVRDAVVDEVGPVSFSVRQGEMVALTGLRGAGQDTVGRALFGLLALDGGEMRIDGAPTVLASPSAAMARGLRFVSGDRIAEEIVAGFTIRENFFLNAHAGGRRSLGRLDHRGERRQARDTGRYVHLSPNDPGLNVEALSGGNQQKVVIGRWLMLAGRILILEDPTAGVDVGAKSEIHRLLLAATEQGMAVIVISTDFAEVAGLCPRAIVFNRGRIIGELADEALTPGALLNAASMMSH